MLCAYPDSHIFSFGVTGWL